MHTMDNLVESVKRKKKVKPENKVRQLFLMESTLFVFLMSPGLSNASDRS